MVSSTLRISDFFDRSVHVNKRAKRDDSLPNSPEVLSSEGSVIMDISEAENTVHARRLHSPSLEVESTDYICPQSTASNESDSQPCDSFCGGSYTRKSKQKIGCEPEWKNSCGFSTVLGLTETLICSANCAVSITQVHAIDGRPRLYQV